MDCYSNSPNGKYIRTRDPDTATKDTGLNNGVCRDLCSIDHAGAVSVLFRLPPWGFSCGDLHRKPMRGSFDGRSIARCDDGSREEREMDVCFPA